MELLGKNKSKIYRKCKWLIDFITLKLKSLSLPIQIDFSLFGGYFFFNIRNSFEMIKENKNVTFDLI